MKLGFFLIATLKISASFCQPTKLELVDGGLKNATSWYINKQSQIISKLPIRSQKPIALNSLGVVMIEFFNQRDSIDLGKEDSLGVKVLRYPRSQFRISFSPRFYVVKFPPSFYFISNGVVVAIYTGIEQFMRFPRESISEFDRKFVSREPEAVLEIDFESHFVELSSSFENGFKVIGR